MLKTAVRDQQGPAPAHTSPQHGRINTSSSASFSPPPTQSPKTQLMSSSVVLRMADFSIYQVSTADQRRSSPKAMISCNKKSLYLPPEMPAIHVEFTEYYFPDGKDYPIPCPNLYGQLNALQLVLDPRSLVWINLFALDLRQSLEQFMEIYKLSDSQKPDEHCRHQGRRPHAQGEVQTSEMVATNTRHPANCTRSHLEALLQAFEEQPFFSSTFASFPRSSSSLPLLHPVFQRHAHEQDTRLHDIYRGLVVPTMGTDALKMPAATDFWTMHFAQFWVDYEGTRGGKGPAAAIRGLLPSHRVSHRQYVFLMLLQRSIKALQQTLQQDLEEMGSKKDRKDPCQHSADDHQPFTVCLGLLLKSAEVSLLLKPVPQPEGSRSPLGSELSPSESRGTLEPGSDAEKGSEGGGSGSEGGAAKGACTVDQLLCGEGSEVGTTHGPAPLVPTSSSTHLNHKTSQEERTSAKNSGKWSSDEGGEPVVDGLAGVEEMGAGLDSKAQMSDPLSDPRQQRLERQRPDCSQNASVDIQWSPDAGPLPVQFLGVL
ncbi:UHRF1-binding protein 1-like [Larimichthys crocea]|uniref:Uncharacterized protein n=1 Tax=Larimichthys crocea TaxID=215358 RepID=A0ACD3Q779_LARCR|nr:UHRF1-binding protein 1-like [Larimichthys crocea]